MAPHAVQVGIKRKRVANESASNENMAHYTRAATRSKRRKSDHLPTPRKRGYVTTTDEDEDDETVEGEEHDVADDETSGMDVDTVTNAKSSSAESSEAGSDQEQVVDEEDDLDSELTPNTDDEDDSSEFSHMNMLT
jgi:hypothetical protein